MKGRRETGRRETGRREDGRREDGRREPAGGRREGASQSRTRVGDRFSSWLRHHRLSAADSLYRVLQSPIASILTWLVIGIALALPAGLNVALDNLDRLSTTWNSPAQISLFLRATVDPEEAAGLPAALEKRRCPALAMSWTACRRTRFPTWSWSRPQRASTVPGCRI